MPSVGSGTVVPSSNKICTLPHVSAERASAFYAQAGEAPQRVSPLRQLRRRRTSVRGPVLTTRPIDPTGAKLCRSQRRFTTAGKSPYEQHPLPPRHVRDQEPRRLGRLQARRLRCARALEPGRRRHPGAEIFPQGRRARAPEALEETQVPSWLWRSVADERALAELPEEERYGGETDARQVFDRLAGTWTYWGWKGGYFSTEDDARAFFDEHRYMLAMQMAAPN